MGSEDLLLTKDEVVLCQLPSADLLLQGIRANVDIDVHVLGLEDALDLFRIFIITNTDGNDEDLSGAQPEWPLPGKVLTQNGRETLDTACNGSVDHDRSCTTRC